MDARKTHKRPKVFVAMSGGVDSSVAALLLVRAGYDVTGVFMSPWQPTGFSCQWRADEADARAVATMLGIPFETWDMAATYERHVGHPMIEAYRTGMTPNPDVECNRYIKFGAFYRRAMRRGADFIATGHYARLSRRADIWTVRAATDTAKDQTYFLWRLDGRQLSRILFPVGGLRKPRVRAIAAGAGLVTAGKKDSQGVCFVGQLDMKTFLASAIPPKAGRILHVDGTDLGTHDGAGYYTVGQRHGLDIKRGGGPYYVLAKDMSANTITVGPATALMTRDVRIGPVHWINGAPQGRRLRARIRYRGPLVMVTVSGSYLRFARPVAAPTSGQSVVFYDGTRLTGGAVIR